MRILVVNCNTAPAVTARIGAAARAVAVPGTEVVAVCAPFGLPLIVTRADWLAAGPATLATLAAHDGDCDAAVIACFGDPGLDAAKELLDVPVLGISEAAFHAACMLGRRFGVVSFTAALRPMFEDCLAQHGLVARCAGFRMGPPFAGDPGTVAEDRLDLLAALCAESVERDGAEVVIRSAALRAGSCASRQDWPTAVRWTGHEPHPWPCRPEHDSTGLIRHGVSPASRHAAPDTPPRCGRC
jgi:Asp/Glu/hydantoin racemase